MPLRGIRQYFGNGTALHSAVTRGLLYVGAAVPFLLALGFHTAGPSAQVPETTRSRPALAFDQYMVNLREVPPRPTVHGWFRFTNRSERTAKVTKFEPSCGCLNPRLEKRVYEPGETGEFFLRVNTAQEEPGPQEYYVDVHYEDPEPREVRLTFKATLPERKVVVEPKALMFYQLGKQATTREIVVTDYRKEPMTIMDLKCSSPLISAEVKTGNHEHGTGPHRFRIAVRVAGQVPPGRHRAALTISTDDAEYDRLTVPLLIQGEDGAASDDSPSAHGHPHEAPAD